jgi:hypothetical protein
VRAVRIANRETSYIKYVESIVDIDKIYRCCEQEFHLYLCCWLGALSAYGIKEQ